MKVSTLFYGFFLLFMSKQAMGEPVDKNMSGPFIGVGTHLFRASQASGASGFGYSGSLDLGYVFKKDTWNRLEVGVEVGQSQTALSDFDGFKDVEIANSGFVMAKGGYGYSLGDHAFGVWRLGVGLAKAKLSYSEPSGDMSTDGDALLLRFGWDAVLPSDFANLLFGGYVQIAENKFDSDVIETMQLNSVALYAGIRLGS